MKIASVKTVEHCLDGSSVKDIIFTEPVTRRDIDRLRELGSVQYYADFPRPFYTVDVPGAFSLRGVEQSTTIRMIIAAGGEHALQRLDSFLASTHGQ